MNEIITVLSPWARADVESPTGLSRRLDTLNNKKIGLFSNFKSHSEKLLRFAVRGISEIFPKAEFVPFQYPLADEIELGSEYGKRFTEWLRSCDAVISAYGDDGSSTMFHGMNTALAEKMNIPAVIVAKRDVAENAVRGAAMRAVPGLRCVECDIPDLSLYPKEEFDTIISSGADGVVSGIIDALLRPLTKEEASPGESDSAHYAERVFSGTYAEINKAFYLHGFTNGTPIVPPTREAVDAMLRGTDLPPDAVLGLLPPRRGIMTVEKLAINAVMAGCLPVYFPLVIAGAKALASPEISLTGWMCSVAGFAPMVIINGPVREDIGLNCTNNVLSPYYLPNTSIARALSLIVLNIAGIRPGVEDRAYGGHEARGGVCFGEDEESSPWEPYHVSAGFDPNDSTVTLVWFQNRSMIKGDGNAASNMRILCDTDDIGFAPGATFILSHTFARTLAEAGFSKAGVCRYISEYARKPASAAPISWLRDNNHAPENVPLPLDDSVSVRKYWDEKHLHIVVSTGGAMPRGCAMLGGGDHGGPVSQKVELPPNWKELVEEFSEYKTIKYV